MSIRDGSKKYLPSLSNSKKNNHLNVSNDPLYQNSLNNSM
jgi:hypothetical protein